MLSRAAKVCRGSARIGWSSRCNEILSGGKNQERNGQRQLDVAPFTYQAQRCKSALAGSITDRTADLEKAGGDVHGDAMESNEIIIEDVIMALEKAASFNQGLGGKPGSTKLWDVKFVRESVDAYEQCLKYFYHEHIGKLDEIPEIRINNSTAKIRDFFLSAEVTEKAFRSMLRCKIPTSQLSRKVRELEKYVGTLGKTPMTDGLSYRMLEANGKSGNVGRALQLLSLRNSRQYKPKKSEFIFAITAIEAAGLYLRKNRNIFLPDRDQPSIDNPTRWLDAILLNMSQRELKLTPDIANRMLNTYTSTGKTGKAVHYFYRVLREEEDDNDEHDINQAEDVASAGNNDTESTPNHDVHRQDKPVRVRLSMRPPPPYHKIPSQVRGKLVHKPGSDIRQLKFDRESDPNWSVPLTEAFSFADSLSYGACGHDPIPLDLISYSILIKACVNRGSLWRAMHILDEIMPTSDIKPDAMAYNILLGGLSNVGDVPTMQIYYEQMLAQGISPTKQTVEAIVGGLLNLGDVAGASTVVQDFFNQHSILPSYSLHLKIVEFALGRGLIFEAKRHVYFIQQLWKWKKNDYHTEKFAKLVTATNSNPKLSKEALQKLFNYFGETLEESDFL